MNGPEVITAEVCATAIVVTAIGGYCACRVSSAVRDAAEKAAGAWREAVEKNWVTFDLKTAVTKREARFLKSPPAETKSGLDDGEEAAKPHLRDTGKVA